MVPAPPSREEFEKHWVRPTYALSRFSLVGDGYAVLETYRRLCNGRLFGAGTNSAGGLKIIEIDSWRRGETANNPAGSLWKTNTFTFDKYVYGGRFVEVTYFGVRFHPDTLQQMADDIGLDLAISHTRQLAKVLKDYVPATPSPPTRPNGSARGPVVPNATVDEWYAALSSDDQARSVRWLHKAAQDALGPSVVRTQVEPFKKDKGRGVKARL
jgi:hypothetical protein